MLHVKKIIIIVASCFLLMQVAAQSNYRLRAVNKGAGLIGVEMSIVNGTPPATGDFVTDIVFGLKWDSSYNIDLAGNIASNYKVKKSGGRITKNGFSYQAFYADATPFNIPANWQLNSWVEIMSIANTQSGSGTGNFFICERGFDITSDPNFGAGLKDSTPVIAGYAKDVLLQAGSLQFAVSAAQQSINTEWRTVNEINNKGFEVQRSDTEDGSFITIGWVNSKGNTSIENYNFTDDKAEPNKDYFYRLKQVDKNGRESLSEIRKARLFGDNSFKLSPNPAKDFIILTTPVVFNANKCGVRIMDAKGAVVFQEEKVIGNSAAMEIPLKKLAAGIYFITVADTDGQVLFNGKFIKQ